MKVAVIHFQPLEKYPPAINFIEFLDEKAIHAKVWSTRLDASYNTFTTNKIKINRLPGVKKDDSRLNRLFRYLQFNITVFIHLLKFRPGNIIYFETLSAFPALLYKKIFGKKVKLFVHYHEYTSPEEYNSEMIFNRLIHLMEVKMYKHFDWISHTNEERAALFKSDVGLKKLVVKIVPNYPPLKWKLQNIRNKKLNKLPLKLVYVGALCTDTMYVREICEWVATQQGTVLLDFWSHNISDKANAYFATIASQWISIKGGTDYHSLPAVLADYDVGLILYKGHIPNYVHNAPNKLFEYLICGLEVLFPEELKGSYPYICESLAPRVLKVDFNSLYSSDLRTLLLASPVTTRDIHFFAEDVYSNLFNNFE